MMTSSMPEGAIPRLRIAYNEDGESVGEVYVSDELKVSFDVMRSIVPTRQRAVTVHGPAGSGKSTFIEQTAAVLQVPLYTMDLDGEDTVTWGERTIEKVNRQRLYSLLDALAHPAFVSVSASEPALSALQRAVGQAMGVGGSQMATVDDRLVIMHDDAFVFFEVNSDRIGSLDLDAVCAHVTLLLGGQFRRRDQAEREPHEPVDSEAVGEAMRQVALTITDDEERERILNIAADPDSVELGGRLLGALREEQTRVPPLTVARYMVGCITSAVSGDQHAAHSMLYVLAHTFGTGEEALNKALLCQMDYRVLHLLKQWALDLYREHYTP